MHKKCSKRKKEIREKVIGGMIIEVRKEIRRSEVKRKRRDISKENKNKKKW